jgi:nicotinamide mononucleotide transporter
VNALLALLRALPWEPMAVALALAYLVLAVREKLACWSCAFASSAIYAGLLWQARLYMEAALSVYYVAMAVYGYRQWRCGGPGNRALPITRLGPRAHVAIIAATLLLALLSGSVLSHYTGAALPYLDSGITWASVITTWLVARKVLENWLYWLAIDSVSVVVYLNRGLEQTAVLFVIYVVLAAIGYREWRRTYLSHGTTRTAPLA